ncbi:MAG: acetyl-CoA synthetase [Thermoplasmata archaeon]|nr:MAG: acetyl-CoA synthetase [Thermoplasmata archaeon]
MKTSVSKLIEGKTGVLADRDVRELLKHYDIPTPRYQIVEREEDLDKIDVPFPVVLKVSSPKILHKTDVGGVYLDIKDRKELETVFQDFKKRFPEEVFLVEEMMEKGVEIIVGLVQDATFGLTIMVGIGGIFTELYKDVSFRIVPIERDDAVEMIEELKGKKLLEGFRNIPANKEKVIDLLLKVSNMGFELMEYIEEMDLNPVFVYKDSICIVDAKIILKGG